MLDKLKNINQLDPKKGRVLISEPFLEDEYFKRSVILLCEYNEEGAFGFILNNIMKIELQELLEDYDGTGFNMSLGGPVQTGNLYYIHTLGEHLSGSVEILDGLFMGGDFDTLKVMLESGAATEKNVRFFLGYSGWSPGQLEEEMAQNAWIVSEINHQQAMNGQDKSLWKDILSQMGGKFNVISNFPENPELN